MTYQNLGYWIGQANDGSTGRHPTGWSNGQRWSTTAAQWMGMYDSSQSALAAMTADRDAWHTNANTAYDGGSWGAGTHWHTRYDNEHAALVSMTADRDNWRNIANGKTTSTQANSSWAGFSGNNWGYRDMSCSLTSPRAGLAHASIICWLDAGGGDPHATVRILVNGGVVATGTQTANGTGGNAAVACQWSGNIGAGALVQVQCTGYCTYSGNNATVNSGTLYLTVGST